MFKLNLKTLLLLSSFALSPFANAGLEEGIVAANEGRFEDALKEFNYLAERGYAPGLYELAQLYEGGFGVKKDYRKAAELYERAIKKHHADSMFALAVLYQDGKGVKLDKEKAISLYERASQKNHPAAQFNLGVMYANGEGVLQDYRTAIKWYQKAAANNFTLAQYNLALMYYEGLGTPKNLEKSYIWNTIAEYNGNKNASLSRKQDERNMLPAEAAAAKEKADAMYEKIQAGLYAPDGGL